MLPHVYLLHASQPHFLCQPVDSCLFQQLHSTHIVHFPAALPFAYPLHASRPHLLRRPVDSCSHRTKRRLFQLLPSTADPFQTSAHGDCCWERWSLPRCCSPPSRRPSGTTPTDGSNAHENHQ